MVGSRAGALRCFAVYSSPINDISILHVAIMVVVYLCQTIRLNLTIIRVRELQQGRCTLALPLHQRYSLRVCPVKAGGHYERERTI
jgi:hypothetical protein